jgi:hypothetical protein
MTIPPAFRPAFRVAKTGVLLVLSRSSVALLWTFLRETLSQAAALVIRNMTRLPVFGHQYPVGKLPLP